MKEIKSSPWLLGFITGFLPGYPQLMGPYLGLTTGIYIYTVHTRVFLAGKITKYTVI